MSKIRLSIIAILFVFVLFFVRKCNNDPEPDMSVTLKTDEKAKVAIKGRTITVVRRLPDGSTSTETKYVPDRAVVIEKNDGSIELHVKKVGLTVQPGVGMIVVKDGAALSLDVQLAYWNRLGLNVGTGIRLGVQPRDVKDFVESAVRPFAAVSYRLPYEKLSNTSLLLGYAPIQQSFAVGFRVQF